MGDSHGGELILYRTEDGRAQVELRAVGGTVWLTQAEIATLFDTTPQNVTQHVRNVYAEGEQSEGATCKKFLQVRQEGDRAVRRTVQVYSLDMILAVGYRVRSLRAAQFRQWATTVLRNYLVKGFALDDQRLKQPGYDYFDELLARIRDIRASEKRFYQKVRDLFAQTSVDYDRGDRLAREFFATIQNKLVFAVTGHTAAELIVKRADPRAANMGLTSWAGTRVRKRDVTISKNYLTEQEVDELNRLTTMFLDYAEDRARRRVQTRMVDWVAQTDRFLDFHERALLDHPGTVSHDKMTRIVHDQFDAFDAERRSLEAAAADQEAAEELAAIEAEARRLAGPEE